MDEAAISKYIADTFADTDVLVASGDSFFYYEPDRNAPDRRFPFATLVTSDQHDQCSNLGRPGVFRLNVGVSKQTFQALFGAPPPEGGYDFTALDRILPHPVYGKMYWVCVLNPGVETAETVKGLLAEAYAANVKRRTGARSDDDEV